MTGKIFVFDIDGTLTSEHYTQDNLLTVKDNPVMMVLAKALQKEGTLVISTARPERYRDQTKKWLAKHKLKPKGLYMRGEDREERVADHMVKFGHLLDIREKFGEPSLWADDNNDNIVMLVRNGVPVIHVKQGQQSNYK